MRDGGYCFKLNVVFAYLNRPTGKYSYRIVISVPKDETHPMTALGDARTYCGTSKINGGGIKKNKKYELTEDFDPNYSSLFSFRLNAFIRSCLVIYACGDVNAIDSMEIVKLLQPDIEKIKIDIKETRKIR